jgi:YgiT-type zinc finger domain-containing protein
MAVYHTKETEIMNCSIQGCPGEYENREILHTVRHKGEIVVLDRVPAQVCSVCGDTLLDADTVRGIERILDAKSRAERNAPVYTYAA